MCSFPTATINQQGGNMSRCRACDTIMPASQQLRTILVPHPNDPTKTTTMKVEEDFCSKCANQSYYYNIEDEHNSDDELLENMGFGTNDIIQY